MVDGGGSRNHKRDENLVDEVFGFKKEIQLWEVKRKQEGSEEQG